MKHLSYLLFFIFSAYTILMLPPLSHAEGLSYSPIPTQDLDAIYPVPRADGSLLTYVVKGDHIWKYTCGSGGCTADFTKTLAEQWAPTKISEQNKWSVPIPTDTNDLTNNGIDAMYTLPPSSGNTATYVIRDNLIWKYTCGSGGCTADFTKTLAEQWAPITGKNVWSPEFASRGELSFVAQGSRAIATLNGPWYLSPQAPLSFSSIPVPGFWKRTFWNFQGYINAQYTTVFHNLYPYPTLQSPVWYAVKFTVPQSLAGKALTLRFGAVAAKADVYLNGVYLGSHLGIYDPFEFPIQHAVRYGQENLLNLAITDSSRFEANTSASNTTLIPTTVYDRSMGGIWRDVELVATDMTSVKNLQVTTSTLSSATASLDLYNAGAAQQVTLSAEIKHADTGQTIWSGTYGSAVTLPTGQIQSLSWQIPSIPGASPWSPESPTLYRLTISLHRNGQVVDRTSTTFGFRTFTAGMATINGNTVPKFLLNGQPYFLKGFGVVSHVPIVNDQAFIRSYLQKVKESGANALRFCCSVPSSYWLAETDRIGLLALVDLGTDGVLLVHNTGLPKAYTDTAYLAETKTEYARIIRSISSHPSVVIYILGNENIFFNPGENTIRTFFNDILQHLKGQDTTRLYLTDAGCQSFITYGTTFTGNFPDVCGQSDITDTHWYYMWYWYNKSDPLSHGGEKVDDQDFSIALDQLFSYPSNKPHIFTEYGGVYTDEQGNFHGTFNPGIDVPPNFDLPPRDSPSSIDAIGTNPVRPDAALAYQSQTAVKLTNVLFSKKDTTRLAGIFFHSFDNFVYNPYNLPWDKLKTWYFASYNTGINAPLINDSTWRNHATLEIKPAYSAIQSVFTSQSTPTPIPGDLNNDRKVNVADLRAALSQSPLSIFTYNLVVGNYGRN